MRIFYEVILQPLRCKLPDVKFSCAPSAQSTSLQVNYVFFLSPVRVHQDFGMMLWSSSVQRTSNQTSLVIAVVSADVQYLTKENSF